MATTDLVTESGLDALNAQIAAAHNALKTVIGPLGSLNTTDQTSVVNALNEALAATASGVVNLSFTRDGTTVTVASDAGTDAVLPAADGSNAGVLTTALFTKLTNIETSADVTDAANIASSVSGVAAKTAPAGADVLALVDSEASGALKGLTIANLATHVVALVVDGSPEALNTLKELNDALGGDANFAATVATSLGNRLRIDTAAQGLNGTQQANALANLGVARSTQDFAGDFTTAIA